MSQRGAKKAATRHVLLAVFVILVFAVSLGSRRLAESVVTAPIVFTVAGASAFALPTTSGQLVLDREDFLHIAESGLAMRRFTDALRISPHVLRGDGNLPISRH